MTKNLITLFVAVVTVIFGMFIYHKNSTAAIKQINAKFYHFEDKTNSLKINNIVQNTAFESIDSHTNLGYTRSIHWFKIEFEAENTVRNFLWEVKNHNINLLTFFEKKNNKINTTQTGDWLPFDSRPIPTMAFVFPINIEAGQKAEYYLKVDKRNEILNTQLSIWNSNEYENNNQRNYFLWGIFFGIALLVFNINIFFWLNTKDPVYFWFAVYILGIAFRQLVATGLGFQYLWPNFPEFNRPDPIIQSEWLYISALLTFQLYFLEIKQANRWLFIISQTLKLALISCFVGVLILQIFQIETSLISYLAISRLQTIFLGVSLLVFALTSYNFFNNPNPIKRYYIYGFMVQLLMQILVYSQAFLSKFFEGNLLIVSDILFFFVFLIDLIVFSYLLAYRYRKTNQEGEYLKLKFAQNEEESNQKLIDILAEEQAQIANNLKNNIGNKLNSVVALLALEPNSKLRNEANLLINRVTESFENLQKNAIPADLIQKGLLGLLQTKVTSLNESQKIKFEIVVPNSPNFLTETQEIQLYRICNELINNILRHSDAKNAMIKIERNYFEFSILITDDGVGFDTEKISTKQTGIGLQNIKFRTDEIGAKLSIESKPGKTATKITLKTDKYTN